MIMDKKLSPNSLALIALTNEYCHLIENCGTFARESFVEELLKILPRVYITVLDLEPAIGYTDNYISPSLDEPTYNMVRNALSSIMADEDIYLEVFIEDMKYSDTPISASISEDLADLYQEFYNLVASLRDLDTDDQLRLLEICKENFTEYWGQTLCNVMRALHWLSVRFK